MGNFEKISAKKVFFFGKLFLCFVVRMLSENYIFVNEKGCEKRGEIMQIVKISTDTNEKPRALRKNTLEIVIGRLQKKKTLSR